MIDPIFLKIWIFEIRYYGLLFALAFLIGYFIANKLCNEFKLNKKIVDDLVIYILIAVLIGARLFHVLFYNFNYFINNPIKFFYVWEGGLSSHGAIIALILLIYFYSKKHKLNFYNIADLFIIPIALGASFVRFGNFINGELVGKITALPWGVYFSNYEGLRHPVQLYQGFYYIFIFLILLYFRKGKKEGTLFWSFIFLDGIFRFFTEFFKDLPWEYGLFNLNLAQHLAIVMILVSIKPLYARFKYYPSKPS